MKSILLLFFLSFSLSAFGQSFCGWYPKENSNYGFPPPSGPSADPCECPSETQIPGGVIIPVVVHIMHNDGPENISDKQVNDAIDLLNYRFANPTNHTLIHKIEFRLAKFDEDGNCFSGILRHQDPTPVINKYTDGNELYGEITSNTALDPEKYLNLYTFLEINNGVDNGIPKAGPQGFAPMMDDVFGDGMAIPAGFFEYKYFGNTEAGADNPSIVTHELGHLFNLFHVWGPHGTCEKPGFIPESVEWFNGCSLNGYDDGDEYQCNSNDYICDTPPAFGVAIQELTPTSNPGEFELNFVSFEDVDCSKNYLSDCNVLYQGAQLFLDNNLINNTVGAGYQCANIFLGNNISLFFNEGYPKENYMSYYSKCWSTFTKQQYDVMTLALKKYFTSLYDSQNLADVLGDQYIGEDFTWDQNNFNGRLIIDDNVTLTIPFGNYTFSSGTEIFMGKRSKIEITSNADVVFDGVTVTSCNDMWESIYVKSGGELIVRNSTFTDGYKAIVYEKGTEGIIENSIFTDCNYGVEFSDLGQGRPVSLLSFIDNVFQGTGVLKPHPSISPSQTIPEAGLRVINQLIINLSGEVNKENSFDNLKNAAFAAESSIVFNNNNVSNCEKGLQIFGGMFHFINNSSFNNNGLACSISGTGFNISDSKFTSNESDIAGRWSRFRSVKIRDNVFHDTQRSIYLGFSDSGINEISGNQFEINHPDGTQSNGNIRSAVYLSFVNNMDLHNNWFQASSKTRVESVLKLNNSSFNKIRENSFLIEAVLSDKLPFIEVNAGRQNSLNCNFLFGIENESRGMAINNSAENTISCNGFSNNGGIALNFRGSCDRSIVKGNEFQTQTKVALLLGEDSQINNSLYNTVIGQQPVVDGNEIYHGNLWSATSIVSDAWNSSEDEVVIRSRFVVDPNITLNVPSNYIPANIDWVFIQSNGLNIYSCINEPQICVGNPGTSYPGLNLYGYGTSSYSSYQGWLWESQYLAAGPSGANYNFQYLNNTEINTITDLNGAISQFLSPSTTLLSQYTANLSRITQIVESGTYSNSSELDALSQMNMQYEIDLLAHETNTNLQLSNARSQMQSMNARETYQNNFYFTSRLILDYILNNNVAEIQNNSSLLHTIASSCIYLNGEAPALAQTLLSEVGENIPINSGNCIQIRRPESIEIKSAVSIYPNPTNATINLKWNDEPEEYAVAIYDISGKLVKKVFNNNNIDISEETNGIYFLNITAKNLTVSKKVVKIK